MTDLEMQRALEADGEKLRHLTGEDHGPWMLEPQTFICLFADTAGRRFEHLGFTIEESTDGWEWTHKDYATNGVTGICPTVFEAIAAADGWVRNPVEESHE